MSDTRKNMKGVLKNTVHFSFCMGVENLKNQELTGNFIWSGESRES